VHSSPSMPAPTIAALSIPLLLSIILIIQRWRWRSYACGLRKLGASWDPGGGQRSPSDEQERSHSRHQIILAKPLFCILPLRCAPLPVRRRRRPPAITPRAGCRAASG
jgi:hypothetical protein